MKYGKLYAVELDALPSIGPKEFKNLVLKEVDQCFDENIFRLVRSNPDHLQEEIRKLVVKKVRSFEKIEFKENRRDKKMRKKINKDKHK